MPGSKNFTAKNMQKKTPKDSLVSTSEMVLPNDTNALHNLMGGRLMYLMDMAGAISAQRHSGRIVVTASVDNISFSQPVALGEVVTLKARVTRAFNSSMEVFIEAFSENIPVGKKTATNKAFFTFVAVDQSGKPIRVPELIPETEKETALYESALRRRQLRLILAGRMKPKEAKEIALLFK